MKGGFGRGNAILSKAAWARSPLALLHVVWGPLRATRTAVG